MSRIVIYLYIIVHVSHHCLIVLVYKYREKKLLRKNCSHSIILGAKNCIFLFLAKENGTHGGDDGIDDYDDVDGGDGESWQ